MPSNLWRPALPFVIGCILLVAGWAAYLAVFNPTALQPQQAVVFGGLTALAGWIVTAYIARRNSTKQHTMAVLTQIRISAEMNTRIKTLYDKFPLGTPMDAQYVATTPENDDVIRAARYILNYYEFLAVALRHGDLDHDLLKDCIRGQLCGMYVKLKALIDDAVQKDTMKPSRRYIDLRRLYFLWQNG